MTMKTMSLKIEEGLNRRLAAAAKKQGTTKSDLVRMALERCFADQGSGCSGSVLELAEDLIGSAEGPADLSVNKKHMKGFGR